MGSNKVWRCKVCGYKFTGSEPPEVCPLCNAPASQFVLVKSSVDIVEKESSVKEERTVAELMIETMINWGITHIFGMIGHSNLGLADAIRKESEKGLLTYIGIRHEGAAAFAVSAYAKFTGRPAACLSIAGPGATNLFTGLWDANIDRAPVLALTGQINTQVLGSGAFQEIDLSAAFESVACWSQVVQPDSDHAELMNLAIKQAIIKRGVGHLIFPNEVQLQKVKPSATAGSPKGRITPVIINPDKKVINDAVQLISSAKRPAIILGYGARNAIPEILKLAEKLKCPIITTFKAKGILNDSHPLACGVQGRSGTLISSHFMNNSDLLIVFGASFSQHTGINPDIPTIQVDFALEALGKFHTITLPILAEISKAAECINKILPAKLSALDQTKEIASKWLEWRTEKKQRTKVHNSSGLNAAEVFEVLGNYLPEDAVIALDVGNNTYSFGRYFECKKQTVLLSGYLGSIGFGYPAAMGARVATERPVIAITGDGGFGQYMGELCTAVLNKMKIILILLNNNELGKISMEQKIAGFPIWKTELHNPEFAQYAEICGALGIKVTVISELAPAINKALDYNGPSLIEVISDPELI